MFAGKTQKGVKNVCVCVCVLVHATQCLIMMMLLGNADTLADPHQFRGLCDGSDLRLGLGGLEVTI